MSAAAAYSVDAAAATVAIDAAWNASVLQTLKDYISIPNQSPGFDPEWETNGYMDQAVELYVNWIKAQNVPGLTLEVLREKGRTPVLFMVIPGSNNTQETVLMYGHMDKQPPMTADWVPGTGPHTPVIKNGKTVNGMFVVDPSGGDVPMVDSSKINENMVQALYGRGGADDGYSLFAAVNAIQVLQAQGLPHSRAVILIENCEESGSRDLPYFLDLKKKEVGQPSLVFCLDSGCHNYEQMWSTTSLRGLMMGTLKVEILTEAVHSGPASGVVPSSFRIIRQLLDRVENAQTGKLPDICYAAIPAEDLAYAKATGETIGSGVYKKFPFVAGAGPVSQDAAELVLGCTWMPTLCITGVDGMPSIATAGNVLRASTALRLSMRTPPSVEAKDVAAYFEKELTRDAPYGAKVTFTIDKAQRGWSSPTLAPWLAKSLQNASNKFYNKPALFTGEGGSIPFMCMLGELYPTTQFVVTGILGPSSNAHGPNEFLHIDFCKKLTGCVAQILTDHYAAKAQA